jgi:predicted GNAT family acetyltransferase
MSYTLIDNEEKKQYEFHIEDDIARIEYIKAQGKIFVTHTEVPVKLEGKGIGSALVKQVLDDIQVKGLALVPLCPFVSAYINRHPEYKPLVLNR